MPDFDIDRRFAEIADLVAGWEFTAARDLVQDLLDRPDLDPTDALTARRVLAEILRELGELTAAYDLAEVVAERCERVHGPLHPHTVHALAVLGMVRHDFDEFDDAEALYQRVLGSGVEEAGDPAAVRAVRLARVNLALLRRDRGDREQARAMLEAAYVEHRRQYGAEDLDTVRIAAELAGLHRDDGDLPAARRLFTIAHAAARSRLGDRHPVTRAMEWELAAVEPATPAPAGGVEAGGVEAGGVQDAGRSLSADRSPSPGQEDDELPPDGERGGDGPEVDPAVGDRDGRLVEQEGLVEREMVQPEGWYRIGPGEWAPPLADLVVSGGRRSRVPAKLLVGLGVVALIVVAIALARADRSDRPVGVRADQPATATTAPEPTDSQTSQAAHAGPLQVRLRDQGTTLAVSWTGAGASVVVALSRAGAPAVVLANLPPETSEYVVRGIEPDVEYCVVVGPVSENQSVSRATSVCTGRRSG